MFGDNLVPNMGQVAAMRRPIDISHLAKDPNTELSVMIIVYHLNQAPRSRHWSISWRIPDPNDNVPVYRLLHVTRENGYTHYTNWGPMTKTISWSTDLDSKKIVIGKMILQQRQQLEQIAAETGVPYPNGRWNCQDWVALVLCSAVSCSLLSLARVNAALQEARN